MIFPNIEAETLSLKSILPEEVTEEYVGWLNDPTVNKFLEVRHTYILLDQQKEFIQKINSASNRFILGIFPPFKQMIGTIKIELTDEVNGTGEIGILIGNRNYWHKNYASEAIRLLCIRFSEAGILRKVTAGVIEHNIGSIKVFEKNGFSNTGFRPSKADASMDTPFRVIAFEKTLIS